MLCRKKDLSGGRMFFVLPLFSEVSVPFILIQETLPCFGRINGQMSSLNFLFLWSSLLLPMNMPPFGLLCTITYHKTSFFPFRHKHYNNTMTSQTFWNPFLSMVKRIFGAIPGEQPSNQRKSMTYFLHIYPLIPQSLQYGKVNARKGQRQESNTSKEETTPAGTDVGRPGILGSAFSRDSLKICMTFRMP